MVNTGGKKMYELIIIYSAQLAQSLFDIFAFFHIENCNFILIPSTLFQMEIYPHEKNVKWQRM